MGGLGSGRNSGRPVIERELRLNIRSLRRQRQFVPDGIQRWLNLTWSNTQTGERTGSASIEYCAGRTENWLRLRYSVTDYWGERTDVNELFRLVSFAAALWGLPLVLHMPEHQQTVPVSVSPSRCNPLSFQTRVQGPITLLFADTRPRRAPHGNRAEHSASRSLPRQTRMARELSRLGLPAKTPMDAMENLQPLFRALGMVRGQV